MFQAQRFQAASASLFLGHGNFFPSPQHSCLEFPIIQIQCFSQCKHFPACTLFLRSFQVNFAVSIVVSNPKPGFHTGLALCPNAEKSHRFTFAAVMQYFSLELPSGWCIQPKATCSPHGSNYVANFDVNLQKLQIKKPQQSKLCTQQNPLESNPMKQCGSERSSSTFWRMGS